MWRLANLVADGALPVVDGNIVWPKTPTKPQRRNSHGVRLDLGSPLTDSEYPLSSSSSSAIPLGHRHSDCDSDVGGSVVLTDIEFLPDEPEPSLPPQPLPVDPVPSLPPRPSGPKKAKGKQKRSRPTLNDCVWTKGKPCCTGGKCHRSYTRAQVYTLRNYFYSLNQIERRLFAKNRIALPPFGTSKAKRYYLETPAYTDSVPVTIDAPVGSVQPVCVTFWKFVLAASSNLIYPRAGGGGKIVVPLSLQQERKRTSYVGVINWLEDMARYHEVSPDSDMVFLPQASRKVVYEQLLVLVGCLCSQASELYTLATLGES